MQLSDVIGQLTDWMKGLALQYGYFGILLISLIGSASIVFPIPYTVVIFALGGLQVGAVWAFEPIWIAIAAGVGSSIGQFSGYLLGFGGRKLIGNRHKKMALLLRIFNKYGPLAVFVFALTPLPDDLLFIPLGVVRYSARKVFVPALAGKLLMNLIVAYSGRYSVQFIRDLFGIDSDWITALIGMTLAIILLVVVFVVMVKVDWEKYVEKYVPKTDHDATAGKESQTPS